MPNWVHNVISIKSDDQAKLDRIVASLEGPTDGREELAPLSFQKLIPRPADKEDDWYNWNVSNWGTKWDASDPVVSQQPGSVTYNFSTAWSPPTPIIAKLIETVARDVVVDYFWEEEQGFGAQVVFDHGNVVSKRDWDIPSTHAEIVERGGECYCADDDEEQQFEDCFYERAKAEPGITPRDLEAIRPLGKDWAGTYPELLNAAKALSK